MKKKKFVLAATLLTLLWGGVSCSSEKGNLLGGSEGAVPDDSEGIRIVVHTPAPDGIILSRALHTAEEYKVHELGVYLFLAEGENPTDQDFKLCYKKTDITSGEGEDGKFTDNGNGSLSYSLPVSITWYGKQAKIALLANEEVTDLTLLEEETAEQPATTLEGFKTSVATAKLVADDSSADIISGNIYATDAEATVTGLPMSAMANVIEGGESFTITPLGTSLSAKLQRIMARIDVCNNTPNLTITGLKITNAAAQAYLFPQETTAAPTEDYYTLLPISPYADDLVDGGPGLPYISEEVEVDAGTGDGSTVTKTVPTTRKHVFYLYEQVADVTPTEVVIDYTLEINGIDRKGSISVPLKRGEENINITRNHLYTIIIGEGEEIQNRVDVVELIVNDWEETVDIDGELSPGKEDPIYVPGDPINLDTMVVGDYYMIDGTVRSGKYITDEEKPYVIGIVFQTYKDAPGRFAEQEKNAVGGTPHGMAMSVKLAVPEAVMWYDLNNPIGLPGANNIKKAYAQISGIANCQEIENNVSDFYYFEAIRLATQYSQNVPAPSGSSDWFLPSAGQWWDFVENLGGFTEEMSAQHEVLSSHIVFYYKEGEDKISQGYPLAQIYLGAGHPTAQKTINDRLSTLGEGNYDPFVDNTSYWTSSSFGEIDVRYLYFETNGFGLSSQYKTEKYYVRPIIVF